ncbi:MAG: type II toxin-antitoxin system RelE/ParE family toxin [Ignavibacteriales bacterium]
MRVALSDEALEDLQRLGDHIAQDSPVRARTFVAELLEKARQIGLTPEGFRLVPRYAHLNIRRRVHGAYLIFYRVEAERVTIIHVLHGAQDYEALLFPDA